MQLDGLNKKGNILTLASANYKYDLPDALLREGRFDRKFRIEICNKNEIKEILNSLIKVRGFKLNEYEIDELSQHFRYESISLMKSIFNSVYFRYGKNAKIDDFINEYIFNDTGNIPNSDTLLVKEYIAVHEAGHALFTHKFSKNYKFLRLICTQNGGKTYTSALYEIDNKESLIEDIDISLAGMVAEKILLKEHNIGSVNDLNKAYRRSFKLVNRCLINDYNYFCDDEAYSSKREASEYQNSFFARRANKFMKKRFRIVKRKLSKCKKELALLAKIIMENKALTRGEMINLLNGKAIR